MKDQITQELNKLIGTKLCSTSRTMNMQMFHFDQTEQSESGRFAIHIQCEWRFVSKGIYTGSRDINFQPSGHYDSNIDWDNETYRDKALTEMLKRDTFIIRDVKADNFGGFELWFDNKAKLQVIPMSGAQDPFNEFWRTFDTEEESDHFVVTSRGIQ